MAWVMNFLLFGICLPAMAISFPELMGKWDLQSPRALEKKEEFPLDFLFMSSDLSKVVMVSKDSRFGAGVPSGELTHLGRWKFYRSRTGRQAFFFKGLTDQQMQILQQQGEGKSYSWWRWLLGPEARAESCGSSSNGDVIQFGQSIAGKISLGRAVQNCHFDGPEMIQKAVASALSLFTDWSLPSLSKLGEMMDSLQYALTTMSADIVKNLAPLVEKAPQVVEALACEILKDQAPALAAAIFVPGGSRRLPYEALKVMERVKKWVQAPALLKLIENLALKVSPAELERFMPILSRLTHVNPSPMKALHFQEKNLKVHFDKHKNEFPELSTIEGYQRKAEEFAKASSVSLVNFCRPNGACAKMNLQSGEYLVVSEKGDFISFFKIDGSSAS